MRGCTVGLVDLLSFSGSCGTGGISGGESTGGETGEGDEDGADSEVWFGAWNNSGDVSEVFLMSIRFLRNVPEGVSIS